MLNRSVREVGVHGPGSLQVSLASRQGFQAAELQQDSPLFDQVSKAKTMSGCKQ